MLIRPHLPAAPETAEVELPVRGPDFLLEPTRHRDEHVEFDDGSVRIPHYASGRLRPYFRASMVREQLASRLATSAAHRRAGEAREADALADLCVTGRWSLAEVHRVRTGAAVDWNAIAEMALSAPVLPGVFTLRVLAGRPPLLPPAPHHVAQTIDRVRDVLDYLRSAEHGRAARRARLGWVAVSGEDDLPWRPVNVPVTSHALREETLRVWGLDVPIRYALAGDLTRSSRNVLLLHGHSSRLEEVEMLAGALANKGYTVIAPDLPGCGYTGSLDHVDVLFAERPPRGEVKLPFADERQRPENHSSLYTLRFLKACIKALVGRVFARAGVTPRIDLLAGGSLGGNLALLFAQTMPGAAPGRHSWVQPDEAWIRRVAAWSPACLWTVPPFVPGTPHGRSLDVEEEDRRRDYFDRCFNEDVIVPVIAEVRQAEQWYRKGWAGKGRAIASGRMHRHEVYSPLYRRWHWAVAHEQMKYSHQHTVAGDPLGRPCYELTTGPLLLMAGDGDNFRHTNVFDRVKEFGPKIPAEGMTLLWTNTGHSIHDERPNELANVLDRFVRDTL